MYPESQKIGIPATNPVRPMADAALLFPVMDNMKSAMLMAAPVLSSITAMMAPMMIRKPMEAMVLPKPVLSISTIFLSGSAATASNSDTTNNEAKAFSFTTDVRNIISRILMKTKIEIVMILIDIYILAGWNFFLILSVSHFIYILYFSSLFPFFHLHLYFPSPSLFPFSIPRVKTRGN
ncbi:hypothetical protein SDC9_108701 [bioreactor metagenome]|uniref:Uncharacterized protein n=1 Tax=bioreactor metagenome TaxID=1076179 RepID=A0A645B9Y6_9ZZZZ